MFLYFTHLSFRRFRSTVFERRNLKDGVRPKEEEGTLQEVQEAHRTQGDAIQSRQGLQLCPG